MSIRRPIAFFDELARNISSHNIPIVIYSGNDDSLVPHWGSEGPLGGLLLLI
jgi:carboxypeptidase D